MTQDNPVTNRTALASLAFVAWAGILLQFWLSISMALANGKSVGGGVVVFLGYFTVLSNLFVALTATLPLIAGSNRVGRWFGRATVLGCATTAILLVGVGYHFLLRNVWAPQGLQWVADVILHYAVPALAFGYWVAFTPRGHLHILAPLVWCLYPIGYIIYAFVRGEILGSYPYHFIDVSRLGYGQSMLNGLGLLIVFIVAGTAVLSIAKVRNPSCISPLRG